jgi:3-isopropylmalate dehydrogenase
MDKANPTSLILSAGMLLDWIARHRPGHENYAQAAQVIEAAVDALLADAVRRTADLGGQLGTRAFTEALSQEITHRLA